MKKNNKLSLFAINLSFIILGTVSQAVEQPQLPKVFCSLSYIQTDEKGVFTDSSDTPGFKVGNDGLTKSLRGFEFEAYLEPICAMDGGACTDAYRLAAFISHGDNKSLMINVLESDQKYRRYSTALVIKNQRLFVNCDHNINY